MSLLALEFPPVSHLVEWPDLLFAGSPLAINKVVLIYAFAVVTTLVLFWVAGRQSKLVPTGVQNVVEGSIDFIEENVVMQTIGPDGLRFIPFLLAMFFFVLLTNILEIVPFVQFPANARMAMPLFLALLVWVLYNAIGIRTQGFFGYLKSSTLPPGVPKAILPLVALIEFVSVFIVRPFSLAVRLFANMLAGHLLLVTFAVLTAALFAQNFLIVILPFSFFMLVFLTAFEILVAVLQAFIFTILTAVYIDAAMHPDH